MILNQEGAKVVYDGKTYIVGGGVVAKKNVYMYGGLTGIIRSIVVPDDLAAHPDAEPVLFIDFICAPKDMEEHRLRVERWLCNNAEREDFEKSVIVKHIDYMNEPATVDDPAVILHTTYTPFLKQNEYVASLVIDCVELKMLGGIYDAHNMIPVNESGLVHDEVAENAKTEAMCPCCGQPMPCHQCNAASVMMNHQDEKMEQMGLM